MSGSRCRCGSNTLGEQPLSRPVDLVYDYAEPQDGPREDAYARLVGRALDVDQRLFARADGVEEVWCVVAPPWSRVSRGQLSVGFMGPDEADDLIANVGGWHCLAVAPDG